VDAIYVWVEGLMAIEKCHFQAPKMPYRGFVNGREPCNSSTKSLLTLEDSHFQATKRPNRGFVNARYL